MILSCPTCGSITLQPERKDWPDEEARLALAECLEHAGLSGLARCAMYMKPGEIEARVNETLHQASFEADKRAWLRLSAAKDVVRRIRKPMNDFDDYKREVASCLSL